MYPRELMYTKTHEWVKNEDGEAVIGITLYAVEKLKDIVFIELPSSGTVVKKDSPFGAIESVKAVFDLNSPVSGEVVAVNEAINTNIDKVVKDPHGEGWIIRIKLSDQKEFDNLMSSEKYEKFIQDIPEEG